MERESTARILALAWIIKVCYAKLYISLTGNFFAICFYAITSHYVLSPRPVPRRSFIIYCIINLVGGAIARATDLPTLRCVCPLKQDGDTRNKSTINSTNERDDGHYFKVN